MDSKTGVLIVGAAVGAYLLLKDKINPTGSKGSLALSVTPAAATVKIDNAVTVGTVSLSAGSHSWTASAAGYTTQSGTISIVAGQTTGLSITLNPVGSTQGYGTAVISCTPWPAATILVDGQVTYPGSYNFLPGAHTWSASADGYTPRSGSFTIVDGQTISLNIVLNLAPGSIATLNVTAFPAGASIILDGSPISAGTRSIMPGYHNWTASAPGYFNDSGSFSVANGETYNLSITLSQQGTQYTLELVSTGPQWPFGTITTSPSKSTYSEGEIVTCTAHDLLCIFDHWEKNGEYLDYLNPVNIMITGNTVLTAVFVLRI